MQEFGASAEWTDVDTIVVKPQPYQEHEYLIENDWSASSYWYEMMTLNGNFDSEVKLEGLMDGSKQGDSVVKYIFSLLGVRHIAVCCLAWIMTLQVLPTWRRLL